MSSLSQHDVVSRVSVSRLKEIFLRYSSIEVDGEPYMSKEDFVHKFLGYKGTVCETRAVTDLVGHMVDVNRDGLISFLEFQAFETMMCSPDALYRSAFCLFDRTCSGSITFDEFCHVISCTKLHKKIPFDLNSDFISLYFGSHRSRSISYLEFGQFLHDFHDEHAIQAFKRFDTTGSGFISASQFYSIMIDIKSHLLTPPVRDSLIALTDGQKVSFPFFMAFNSVLTNMELMKRICLYASNGSKTQHVDKQDFLLSAQLMSQVTPFEIDLLYKLVAFIYRSNSLHYTYLLECSPEQHMKHFMQPYTSIKAVESPEQRNLFIEIVENVYRFTLGSIAGAIGASSVYPIDLVKTRMQNQRSVSLVGELMYKHSWDCFKKVVRFEGVSGLYRGLLPQLVGVAPEKAIKLTVNDFVRSKFMQSEQISLSAEVFAGMCAGASQVVFTNPLEIVKIRLQMAGELPGLGARARPLSIVRELGLLGLYKGARACLMRDIPFSAIYFPVYSHTKSALADENNYNALYTLLVAGALGGVPAAFITTPADVVKTRLQVAARSGQTTYSGISDAIRKIYSEEGFMAFWKGSLARVCRSSPQFGVTLLFYEVLQRFFYVDFGGMKLSGSVTSVPDDLDTLVGSNPDHIGGFRRTISVLKGLESKFGLSFAKQ